MTRKQPNEVALAVTARNLTKAGSGGRSGRKRRAFDLAHRARRMLELATETASRERWDELQAPRSAQSQDPVAVFAALCTEAAIRYPVYGEAAVYAALLDAVDTARRVSDRLHQDWLATQRTEKPVPVPRGPNRLAAPLATGCSRADCRGSSDEEITS